MQAKEAGSDAKSSISRFAARAEDKAENAGEEAQRYGFRFKDKVGTTAVQLESSA